MARILTIGSVTHDMFFPTEDGVLMETPGDLLSLKKVAFELGAKFDTGRRCESVGGCSVNVGVALKKLGHEVQDYCFTGDDFSGKWIRQELEKIHINTRLIREVAGEKSDVSAIVVDVKSGDRLIFSSHEVSRIFHFDAENVPVNFDWVFIGDLSGKWRENLGNILDWTEKNGIKVAINPRQKMIHEDARLLFDMISRVDLLALNRDESFEILKSSSAGNEIDQMSTEADIVRALADICGGMVFVTDGERGAWSIEGNAVFHAEALRTQAIDATGAGDAFASGFFAALLHGKSVREMIGWGIANSSSVVEQYGAQAGLLGVDQIEEKAKKISTVEV